MDVIQTSTLSSSGTVEIAVVVMVTEASSLVGELCVEKHQMGSQDVSIIGRGALCREAPDGFSRCIHHC